MIKTDNKFVPISLLISESIRGCSRMQKILYKQFAPEMYQVCLRYSKNSEEAKDILQDAFIRVFKNLDKFKGTGSFEGWIRTIVIRCCLTHCKKSFQKIEYTDYNLPTPISDRQTNPLDKLTEKDLFGMVTHLSPGYYKVFMMYVVEGYKHQEIAAILGCSESTSKSQFYRSRAKLQNMLKKTG